AEQAKPINRKVAIKIVRLGMNTESVIARFDIECQALALMDHPNIAKVFETGTTRSGRPFFVMEHVEGEKITTVCDGARLTLRERLGVFIRVCDAIQHAHQKGVVHRDIKPSNILMAGPVEALAPKIIDFGIAKAMNPDAFPTSVETAHDQLFGTPAYMSPEQIDLTELDVDTRSDIYSLGVLLYELLTSCTPFEGKDFSSYGISRIRNMVLTLKIRTLSQVLADITPDRRAEAASARRSTPLQLGKEIKGDLDRIVMKAIDRDRSRRYSTVNSLILDIQRYLSNQAVMATPPSPFYLFRKFVRRNRITFVAGNLLVTSLVAGLVTSTVLYKRQKVALATQTRLWKEAQDARSEEVRLRLQADARGNIARVAILLDQGRIDDAEALRKNFPLSSVEPSLEAATVFRSLGDWNANMGRREEAVQCYKRLMQANRLDDPSKVLGRTDVIAAAAVILDYSREDYLAFRADLAENYSNPGGNIQAERLLKVCLIAPAGGDLLERLAPAVRMMGDPKSSPYPAWASLAQALYEYRGGDHDGAIESCRTALTDPQIAAPCKASAGIVTAMALFKKGLVREAAASLAEAKAIIAKSGGQKYIKGYMQPIWYDWIIANILAREAESGMGQVSR
ncbi:MAG: serine/threonine protein kinase, partial [Verrucomicrobiaceae bacterium]